MRCAARAVVFALSATASAQATFAPPLSHGPSAGTGIVTSDFNRDGSPDVASTSANFGSLFVGFGGGDGSLGPISAFAIPGQASEGDLNGDGFVDLTLGRVFTDMVNSAINNGAGGFTFAGTAFLGIGEIETLRSVRVADIDLDGDLDALCLTHAVFFAPSRVIRILGTGAGGFGAPSTWTTLPSAPVSIETSDINSDGAADAAVIFTNASFVSYLNTGTGGAAAVPGLTPVIGFAPAGFAFSDVNRDGSPDITVAGRMGAGSTGSAYVAMDNGFGGFSIVGVATPIAAIPNGIAFRDVTGDGVPDSLVSVATGTDCAVLASSSSGVLSAPQWIAAGATLRGGIASTDLNGDGRNDLALATEAGGGSITTLRNTTSYPAGVQVYGTGTAGCNGRHGLSTNSAPSVGNAGYTYLITQAPKESLGLLISTNAQDPTGSDPFQIFVTLHVGFAGATEIYGFDVHSDEWGNAFATVPIPNNPMISGLSYYSQAIFAWQGSCLPSAFGLSSSRAVASTIQ